MKFALASAAVFVAAYVGSGLLGNKPTPNGGGGFGKAAGGTNDSSQISAIGARASPRSGELGSVAGAGDFIALVLASPLEDLPELYDQVVRDREKAGIVAQHWAESDPEGLWAHLEPRCQSQATQHRSAIWHLFREWGSQDLAGAAAAARSAPSAVRKMYAVESTVTGALEDNPVAAVRAMLKDDSLLGYFRLPTWAEHDPAGAVELFAPLADSPSFSNRLGELAALWAKQDPAAAAGWAGGLDWKSRSRALWQVGSAAVATDLGFAQQLFQAPSLRGTEYGGELGEDIAEKMAESDPLAALEWVAANLSGSSHWSATNRAFDALCKNDPDAARGYFDQVPVGRSQNAVAKILGRVWAKTDSPAALDWAESLTGQAKLSAVREIGKAWLAEDEGAALARARGNPIIEETFLELRARDIALEEDHQSAVDWLAAQPESASRSQVTSEIVSGWALNNPAMASEFATSLPPGEERASAVGLVAARYYSRSTERALDWIKSLPAADREHVFAGVEKHLPGKEAKAAALAAIKALP